MKRFFLLLLAAIIGLLPGHHLLKQLLLQRHSRCQHGIGIAILCLQIGQHLR